MGVDIIVSKCSHGAKKEGSPAVMWPWAVTGKAGHHSAQDKDGHEAWLQVPLCHLRTILSSDSPSLTRSTNQMDTLRPREVKQLLQGHTAGDR